MPAPEDIRGLQPGYLIHQSRQFVRTNSNGFVPTVPFSKFMKTQMLAQFRCSWHGGNGCHFSLPSLRGEGPVMDRYINGTAGAFPQL